MLLWAKNIVRGERGRCSGPFRQTQSEREREREREKKREVVAYHAAQKKTAIASVWCEVCWWRLVRFQIVRLLPVAGGFTRGLV